MRGRAVLAGALLIAALASPTAGWSADSPWQGFQDLTADAVFSQWKTPPSEYGPEPYYALAPALEGIRSDFDNMKRLGYRAVTVQYAGGAAFTYLSPEYFDYFKRGHRRGQGARPAAVDRR